MIEIRHQIPLNATPEKVYAALATEAGLRSWWTADAEADAAVGGKAEFGFGKRQVIFRMRIDTLEPGKEVVWTCQGDQADWKGTTLAWRIAREGDVTVLRFTQSGWKAMNDYVAMCNSTWGELMYRLKDHVEGKNPGPHWTE
jgi:uncharacterized protein YndB with AHSA1/START domain